jgi:hypothetical protein
VKQDHEVVFLQNFFDEIRRRVPIAKESRLANLGRSFLESSSPEFSSLRSGCRSLASGGRFMTFTTKRLALIALVGCSISMWRTRTDRDVTVAQGRKAVTITRIFAGADGLSHAEDIELKLNERGVAEMPKATGAEFSVRPPTPGANARSTGATGLNDAGWHTGPARQFVITLSGNSEVEVSGGVHVLAGAGHINLIEDTTGKGHITRNFGPDDRIALTIPLVDGAVIEGTRTARIR